MPSPDPLARNLVKASMELLRRRSWESTRQDAPILLHVPSEDDPLAGVLVGQTGDDRGLFLFRGPDALERLHHHVLGRAAGDEQIKELDVLGIGFRQLSEIPPELRKTLELAQFQARRTSLAPDLFRRPPNGSSRTLNRREMKTALSCLEALFIAEDRGELEPRELAPGSSVLELHVSGAGRSPEVRARFTSWSTSGVGDTEAAISFPDDLASLPRTDESWLASSPVLPGRIEGDDRVWNGLVLIDEATDRWINSWHVPRGDDESLVARMVETLRARGLPREIVFFDELLANLLAPGLTALGVKIGVNPFDLRYPGIHSSVLTDSQSATGPDWARMLPETHDEWRPIHQDSTRRLSIIVHGEELVDAPALGRYFGDEQEARRLLLELENLSPFPSFLEWLMADYRSTRRSETFLEKQLQKRPLPAVDKMLIQGRIEALLSFFRVQSIRSGESMEVEDIFGGGRHIVYDPLLSNEALTGRILPLRLSRVQEWTFPLIAGPPLPSEHLDGVLGELESCGLELTHEGMREDAHLLGNLWVWHLAARGGTAPPGTTGS
jgi:hypothetical protein